MSVTFHCLLLSAFGTFILTQPVAHATVSPTPGAVKLIKAVMRGSGCPQGIDYSATYRESDQEIKITMPAFSAEVGDGISRRHARKICNISLNISHPDGWHFSPASFHYSLKASVAGGIKGELQVKSYFQGERETLKEKRLVSGPTNLDENSEMVLPEYWSPCGKKRDLVLSPSVKLMKHGASAGKSTMILKGDAAITLKWKRCTSK